MILTHKSYEMGTAPYSFRGIWSQPSSSMLEQNPSAYNLAMSERPACCKSHCDHCGMSIAHHHIIKDAQGKLFCVGSSCIEKLDSVELITASKLAEKKRQKQIRKDAAEAKRIAKRASYESEMKSQRESNGGLTDWELSQKTDRENLALKRGERRVIAEPIISALENAGGDFCKSVARGILDGEIPKGRCAIIVVEIMAKNFGRKGTKAYTLALPIQEAIFNDIANGLFLSDLLK